MSANTPLTVRRIDTTVLAHVRNHAGRIEVEKNETIREKRKKAIEQLALGAYQRYRGQLQEGVDKPPGRRPKVS